MFIRHLSDGRVCCEAQNFSDLCGKCQTALKTTPTGDLAPPDPYALGIATLRAAAGTTPPTPFEQTWREQGLRDLEATRAALDADQPPRLTTAQLATDDPPDPYTIALARRHEKESR